MSDKGNYSINNHYIKLICCEILDLLCKFICYRNRQKACGNVAGKRRCSGEKISLKARGASQTIEGGRGRDRKETIQDIKTVDFITRRIYLDGLSMTWWSCFCLYLVTCTHQLTLMTDCAQCLYGLRPIVKLQEPKASCTNKHLKFFVMFMGSLKC